MTDEIPTVKPREVTLTGELTPAGLYHLSPPATVVIAGSRALPPGIAPRLVIRFLADLPIGSKVLLRGPAERSLAPYGPFELSVFEMCELVGLEVDWRRPSPTVFRPGRKAVWDRDMEMLIEADVCLCFYDVGQIGDEESGTVALVDKAIALDIPVYAYALTPEDGVIRVGEHDPKNEWSTRVPAA